MAYNPGGTWEVTFSFLDNNGKRATTSLDYSFNLPFADVQTAALGMAAAMDGVSDAKLVGYTISANFLNDDTTAIPASSEVERKLSITLGDAAGVRKLATIQVPSPVFALEQPRTDAILDTVPEWVTLRGLLIAGGIGAGNGPVHWLGGEDFGSVLRAVITHRSRESKF